MSYAKVEELREIRLWLTQIIAPIGIGIIIIANNPIAKEIIKEKAEAVAFKAESVVTKVKNVFVK